MKATHCLLTGFAATLALGCGKSDAEKFADSWCGEVAKCCSQAGLPGDGKMCHQWMSFASAGGSYSSQGGEACLAEMRSEIGAGTFCTDLGLSACDSAFGSRSGSKKPGETCKSDGDCAPSSEGTVVCASLYVDSVFIDKCQVRMPGKAGDTPCVGTQDGAVFMSSSTSDATDVPPRGFVCDLASGVQCKSGSCVALGAVGATCSYTSDCVRSAFCDYAKDLCTARVAAGATCTGSDSAECVDGAYCPTSSKQCTAKAANGASCTTSSMCLSDYCSNSTCQGDSGSNFGLSLYCGSN